MSDAALQSYLRKWLAAQPAQRLAMPFIDETAHAGHLALAALEQEWIDAIYGIREPQVAQVKLNWWAEELAGAPASGGRHPLTQALFSAPQVEHVELAQWLAPIRVAMEQVDASTPADFAEQCAQAQAFHGALAELETRWWYGPQANASRARAQAVIDHLLHATAMLEELREQQRLALPMARLARHGMNRESLGKDSAARRAAVGEQLADVAALAREARPLCGPLSLFRGLQMRENARLLRRARRAADPLARLRADRTGAAPGTAFRAWSAARHWHRHATG